MSERLWLKDFEFHRDRLRVRNTDIVIPYNWGNFFDILIWLPFFAVIWFKSLFIPKTFTVGFQPYPPRPWYLIWPVTRLAGGRLNKGYETDYIMHFEDTTEANIVPDDRGRYILNGDCTDISKSHVADVFERIFGYALSVNPATYTGQAVMKSEKNGVHDGKIIQCPAPARAGYAYQRVIDNRDGDYVQDLRCPTIGGEIDIIYIKRRPLKQRFANMNSTVTLHEPDNLLSATERDQIKRFAKAMKLDWGGMDILRDNIDGRIYIVDVNKTDMGPPIALKMGDKVRSTRRLAARWQSFLSAEE